MLSAPSGDLAAAPDGGRWRQRRRRPETSGRRRQESRLAVVSPTLKVAYSVSFHFAPLPSALARTASTRTDLSHPFVRCPLPSCPHRWRWPLAGPLSATAFHISDTHSSLHRTHHKQSELRASDAPARRRYRPQIRRVGDASEDRSHCALSPHRRSSRSAATPVPSLPRAAVAAPSPEERPPRTSRPACSCYACRCSRLVESVRAAACSRVAASAFSRSSRSWAPSYSAAGRAACCRRPAHRLPRRRDCHEEGSRKSPRTRTTGGQLTGQLPGYENKAGKMIEHAVHETVNVRGLENVLMAAKRTPTVKKIIYTSPFFAIGPTDGYVADETDLVFNGGLSLDFGRLENAKVVEVMLMGGIIFEHLGDRAWQASRVAELEAEIHMSNDRLANLMRVEVY
ncbi:hypothetical protein U9M48_023975 [Paspalum notatum var. saurae]|uniref:Uncharacterized protein n=1 Tax=Paspalum notatum var. saurae TaxID=547442 RepID=A0AAQ3TMF0_PASNO